MLNQIRQKYDVSFVLEIVPTIYANDINPCLAPSLDVIDFCHETRTQIDIDMDIYDSENESVKQIPIYRTEQPIIIQQKG